MNKSLFVVAVIALVLGGLVGYALHGSVGGPGGTTTNYQSALSQAALYNWESSAATDLANLHGGATTTAAIDFPNLTNASGTSAQSTTTVPGIPGSLGDVVFVYANTPTTGASFIGQVTTASTTAATFTISELANTLNTAVDATSTTFTIVDISKSTFTSSLQVSTTSSP